MYHPRRSIYTPPPQRRFRATARPLDAELLQSLWTPRSAGAIAGKRLHQPEPLPVLPPNCAPLVRQGQPNGMPSPGLALPLYLDSSMLAAWRSCRRKHFWSTLNALYPSGKSVHLIAGGAIANGVEAARKWVFSQQDPAAAPLSAVLEAAYPAFTEAWGDYQPPDTPRNAKTFINTWSALANYLELYHPGTDPVQPLRRTDGSPATEYRFAIPLPVLHPSGDPFLFVGRFDMVGVYGLGSQSIPVVLDEKTTSSFSMGWENSWDLRGQFMGYIWALRQQGISISHAVVRGIAIQKTQFDTRSALVHFPNHLIDRWETQLLADAQGIANAFKAVASGEDPAQWYPFDFADACQSYGGCAFATLCCAADPHDFTSNYIKHVWDPLNTQPVQEEQKQ